MTSYLNIIQHLQKNKYERKENVNLEENYKFQISTLLASLGYLETENQILGKGSYGVVFKTRKQNSIEVALKVQVIPLSNLEGSDYLKKILIETKNMDNIFDKASLISHQIIEKKLVLIKKYLLILIESESGTSLRKMMEDKKKQGLQFTKQETDHLH